MKASPALGNPFLEAGDAPPILEIILLYYSKNSCKFLNIGKQIKKSKLLHYSYLKLYIKNMPSIYIKVMIEQTLKYDLSCMRYY